MNDDNGLPYPAHIRARDKAEQGVFEHCDSVASLAYAMGQEYNLPNTARLCGRYHDIGKNREEFKSYIKAAADGKNPQRGSVIHSTYGAVLVNSLAQKDSALSQLTAELVRNVICSHHGLRDCLTTDGAISFDEAKNKIGDSWQAVCDYVVKHYGSSFIKDEFNAARQEMDKILNKISKHCKNEQLRQQYICLYLALYTRLMLSILIDADRTDTACFEENTALPVFPSPQERHQVWKNLLDSFEQSIELLQTKAEPTPLDIYRKEISSACRLFNGGASGIYRLVVPCGAGKTLSSLRYALHTAQKYNKKHIFYIAPFNSILEQNADEIRKYIGNSEAVLEHHSNIVFNDDENQAEQEKKYQLLTENWQQAPIIATTAVQFLNTLFDGKTASVRRMQALGDSIIIIDEIQALPLDLLKPFNMAMNFLAAFCNTAIVLCSATQPLLDDLDTHRIIAPVNIIDDEAKYAEAFRRVEIKDYIYGEGKSIDQAAEFAFAQLQDVHSLLVIVNTKSCAQKLFKLIKSKTEQTNEACSLFHLSTNMCPAHRKAVIDDMRKQLNDKTYQGKIVCISTSLIEAGVDISFEKVIRSLNGLDSIVQAAGRCNRNRETQCGTVAVIHIKDENNTRLGNMTKAQEMTREVFYKIRANPQDYPGGALAKKAMDKYYALYFKPLLKEMEYPLKSDREYTLLDLLSTNPKGQDRLKKSNGNPRQLYMKQAFKAAGSEFCVINDVGQTSVIVAYDENAAQLINKLKNTYSLKEKHSLLRQLQPYTVNLHQHQLDKLANAIDFDEENGIRILAPSGYDKEHFGIKSDLLEINIM